MLYDDIFELYEWWEMYFYLFDLVLDIYEGLVWVFIYVEDDLDICFFGIGGS